MINLELKELTQIKAIIAKHVPQAEVSFFGSRAKNTAQKHSDIDILIKDKTKIPLNTLSLLKADFEDSNIPFRVDVLDYYRTSLEFIKNISSELVTV